GVAAQARHDEVGAALHARAQLLRRRTRGQDLDPRSRIELERLEQNIDAVFGCEAADAEAAPARAHSGFQRRVRYWIFGVFLAAAGCAGSGAAGSETAAF